MHYFDFSAFELCKPIIPIISEKKISEMIGIIVLFCKSPFQEKMHNLHKYWKFPKKVKVKNQKCSESSDMPRKVFLKGFLEKCIFCIFMHIFNFLVFFLCSSDQYLPPHKGIKILSALVFLLGYDNTDRHYVHQTQHTTHYQNIGKGYVFSIANNEFDAV